MSGPPAVPRGTSLDPVRRATGPRRPGAGARLLLGLLRVYRWTASVRAPRCRFHPTCSTYATEAIRQHGAARGGWLSLRRLSRCHPWNPGGVDHVPRT